jgi:DNA-binding MarR family transcriptional regulator
MRLEALPDLPCACATARRTARVLTQFYGSHLRSAEIEVPQFSLLSVLHRWPGCNQEAVGRMLAFDKTTLSRNLKLLNRKGWIEPAPSQDRREKGFRLTDAGRERLEAANAGWSKAQQQLQSGLTPAEWENMWKAFRTVTQAVRGAHKKLDIETGEA